MSLLVLSCSSASDAGRPAGAGGSRAGSSGQSTAGSPAGTGGASGMTTPPTGGAPAAAGSGGRAGTGTAGASGRGAAGSGGTGAAGASGNGCTANIACKLAAPATTGDVRQDCVNRINQFRMECACLGPLTRWTDAEACADMMAQHDSMTGTPHSGFSGNICTPRGNGQNECPKYASETSVIGTCLQQMWSEGPPPQTPCEGQCFQTYGHFINMTNKSFKKVACGVFKAANGQLWAVQNFAP